MPDFVWWIVIFAALGWFINYSINKAKQKSANEADLEERQESFLVSQDVDFYFRVVAKNGYTLIQASDGRAWYFNPDSSDGHELRSDNLLAAEVLEDGEAVTQAHRGRQIGGAMVGGLVAGSVGALIGGLGAKQKTRNKVSSISLKLTIRNASAPIVELVFFAWPGGMDVGPLSNKAYNMASEWCARMEIVMREDISAASPQPVASTSNAEQLAKWASLLESGHITASEFDEQKRKLLES